jgi:acyl-CoA thioester hydrolase
MPHLSQFRVYYEDTDFSGLVYHANYLRYLERGRTDYLREHGITQSSLHREEDGLVFVVARMTLDFLRPAGMDDLVTVTTDIEEIRGASMRMRQAVTRDTIVLVRAEVVVAALRGGRAVRFPPSVREALTSSRV